MIHGTAHLLNFVDDDPMARRPLLNIVSVDNYHEITGFVDAVIGLAGNGQPELFTAQLTRSVEPFVEQLPSGLRFRLGRPPDRFSLPRIIEFPGETYTTNVELPDDARRR